MYTLRRCASAAVLVALTLTAVAVPAGAGTPGQAVPRGAYEPSVVVRWNAALVEAVRRTGFRPMWTARALAIVHTAMYDAWAAYDPVAVGVYWDGDLRRPYSERDEAHVRDAVSLAAYRALVDLFPSQTSTLFDPLLRELGLATVATSDPTTPAGLGSRCAALVVASRHGDGANQLGLAGAGPYADYTGYTPVNTPELLRDPNRWQPLRAADGTAQAFIAPQWRLVTPFALTSPSQFRPGPPPLYPDPRYAAEADAVRQLSADLTDREKVIAEYWADGPNTETPPGAAPGSARASSPATPSAPTSPRRPSRSTRRATAASARRRPRCSPPTRAARSSAPRTPSGPALRRSSLA